MIMCIGPAFSKVTVANGIAVPRPTLMVSFTILGLTESSAVPGSSTGPSLTLLPVFTITELELWFFKQIICDN